MIDTLECPTSPREVHVVLVVSWWVHPCQTHSSRGQQLCPLRSHMTDLVVLGPVHNVIHNQAFCHVVLSGGLQEGRIAHQNFPIAFVLVCALLNLVLC
jgi:hypothetical protein